MAEDVLTRLKPVTAEQDRRVPEYRHALESAISTYDIPDYAFAHDKQAVINGAVRLLNGYDVDTQFVVEPERSLFALAVTDSWLSTNSPTEKKALLDILKLVATGKTETGELISFSGKVRILAAHNFSRGLEFDPQSLGTITEYLETLNHYIDQHIDENLTAELEDALADWSPNSKLTYVRKLLNLTPEAEKSVTIIVLDQTAEQMFETIGYTSICAETDDGNITIILNSDRQEYDSLEHEYAHSQSVGINAWYQILLFRGLNEALTEAATKNPETYPRQRQFLTALLEDHPEYESLLYNAYLHGGAYRTQLLATLTRDYTLAGFLILARLAPIDNPKLSGNIGASIFIEPEQAYTDLLFLSSAKLTAASRTNSTKKPLLI